MYTLTLTFGDRMAIDWIGGRYPHGYDLYRLLWATDCKADPEDADWDDPRSITFRVPEHVAWQISELLAGSLFDCLTTPFKRKLRSFLDSIV